MEGAPPHRLGQGRWGWGRAATSNSIPQDNGGLTTEEERAVQARRPPGREREKAVLVRVHHHHHHHRHHLHDHHRPPPPAARAAAHSGEGSRATPGGGTHTGNPILTARGGPRGPAWGPRGCWPQRGLSCLAALGVGTGEGRAGEGGRRGCSSPWPACPWAAGEGVGEESEGQGPEGGGCAQRLETRVHMIKPGKVTHLRDSRGSP